MYLAAFGDRVNLSPELVDYFSTETNIDYSHLPDTSKKATEKLIKKATTPRKPICKAKVKNPSKPKENELEY